jgi:hypothetical protein
MPRIPSPSRLALAAAFLVTALGACAAMPGHRPDAAGGVQLGPHGRAEGRLHIQAGAATKFSLSNAGPGKVDFAIRTLTGADLNQGALTSASVEVTPHEPTTLVIVLESRAPEAGQAGGARVGYEIEGPGADITWDLSRAMR